MNSPSKCEATVADVSIESVVSEGNLEKFKSVYEKIEMDYRNHYKLNGVFIEAAKKGNLNIVDYLVKRGHREREGCCIETAIEGAAKKWPFRGCEILIEACIV